MTTYYTLPEWLGTREVVIVPRPEGRAQLEVGGERAELVAIPHTTCRIVIARSELPEVKPPLPPVPNVPAVLIGELVWARDDIHDEGPVFLTPGGPTLSWEELNNHAAAQDKPIIPLVPDPADDAPALPWHLDDVRSGRASVFKPRNMDDVPDGMTHAHVWKGDYSAGECRRIAAAFWRAAREVDQP